MPICLIIAKQIKLRLAISRLKRAKLNAYRESIHLPPVYPWYSQIFRWTWSGIRGLLLYTFCWCLVCKCGKEKRSKWDTLWTDGTLANSIMKSFFGLLVGLFMTHFLTLFLIFQLNFEPVTTSYACFSFGLLLILGLSFSQSTRCFMFLTLPQFFTKKGRAAILAYCFILAMSGPGKNITTNMEILTESLICGQEMAHNATQGLIDLVKDPLSALGATFRRMKDAIVEVATNMTNSVGALMRAILAVVNVIKAAFRWLKGITSICNKKLGTPFERCISVFDQAIADCKVELGIMDWMCEIVTVVQYLCHVARIVDLLCWLPSLVKEAVFTPIKRQLTKVTDAIKVFFDVRLDFTDFYQLKHSFNSSKSFHQIVQGMKSEIMGQVHWFLEYMDWVDLLISMFMFLAFYKALVYRFRFLHSERHDNFYITTELVRLDLTRRRLGKETIFPLKYRESYTFIQTFSLVLLEAERKALMLQLILVTYATIKISVIILIDYAFYRFLLLVKKHGAVHVDTGELLGYNIKVEGEGFMADMYRAILHALSPIGDLLPVFDTTPCLPIPVLPNYYEYGMIYFLLGICYIACITEPYGMRLRHIICEIYYPDRKIPRARWLYTHILSSRGNFLMYARSQLKGKMGGDGQEVTTYKVGLLDRLSHTVPCFRRLMFFIGARKKQCFLCGKSGVMDNREDFVHCPSCDSVYCNDCYEEIEFRCIACMSPIEFGDISEESGSHSSEDQVSEAEAIKPGIKIRKTSLDSGFKDKRNAEPDAETYRKLSSKRSSKPKLSVRQRVSSGSSSSDDGLHSGSAYVEHESSPGSRIQETAEELDLSRESKDVSGTDRSGHGPLWKSLSLSKFLIPSKLVTEMKEKLTRSSRNKQNVEETTEDEAESESDSGDSQKLGSESGQQRDLITFENESTPGSSRKSVGKSKKQSRFASASTNSGKLLKNSTTSPGYADYQDSETDYTENEPINLIQRKNAFLTSSGSGSASDDEPELSSQSSFKLKFLPKSKSITGKSREAKNIQTIGRPNAHRISESDSSEESETEVDRKALKPKVKFRKIRRGEVTERNSSNDNETGSSSGSEAVEQQGDLITFENELTSRFGSIRKSVRKTEKRSRLPSSRKFQRSSPSGPSSSYYVDNEGTAGDDDTVSYSKSFHKSSRIPRVKFAEDNSKESSEDEDSDPAENLDVSESYADATRGGGNEDDPFDDGQDDPDGTCHHHQGVDEDVYEKYSDVVSELTETLIGDTEDSGASEEDSLTSDDEDKESPSRKRVDPHSCTRRECGGRTSSPPVDSVEDDEEIGQGSRDDRVAEWAEKAAAGSAGARRGQRESATEFGRISDRVKQLDSYYTRMPYPPHTNIHKAKY